MVRVGIPYAHNGEYGANCTAYYLISCGSYHIAFQGIIVTLLLRTMTSLFNPQLLADLRGSPLDRDLPAFGGVVSVVHQISSHSKVTNLRHARSRKVLMPASD